MKNEETLTLERKIMSFMRENGQSCSGYEISKGKHYYYTDSFIIVSACDYRYLAICENSKTLTIEDSPRLGKQIYHSDSSCYHFNLSLPHETNEFLLRVLSSLKQEKPKVLNIKLNTAIKTERYIGILCNNEMDSIISIMIDAKSQEEAKLKFKIYINETYGYNIENYIVRIRPTSKLTCIV